MSAIQSFEAKVGLKFTMRTTKLNNLSFFVSLTKLELRITANTVLVVCGLNQLFLVILDSSFLSFGLIKF